MQVTVPRPDVKGRTEILNLYLSKIKVDPGRSQLTSERYWGHVSRTKQTQEMHLAGFLDAVLRLHCWPGTIFVKKSVDLAETQTL